MLEEGLNECLVKAVGVGYLEAAERLMVARADINCRSPAEYGGLTALQAAAKGGHLEVVEKLLTVEAEVIAKAAPNSGRTALQGAAEQGHF